MSCYAKPAASPLPSSCSAQRCLQISCLKHLIAQSRGGNIFSWFTLFPSTQLPPIHGLAVGSRWRCSLSSTRTQRSPAERHLQQINPPYVDLALSSLILYVLHRSPWSSWRVTPGTSIRALLAAPLPRQEARSNRPGSWLHPGTFGVLPALHHEEQELKTQPGASQAAGCTAPAELSHPFFPACKQLSHPTRALCKKPQAAEPLSQTPECQKGSISTTIWVFFFFFPPGRST